MQLVIGGAILFRLSRVGNDVPDRVAFGQQFAVGAVDVAPGGGQFSVLELLGHGLGAILFGVTQLQRVQLVDQDTEEEDQKGSDQ